MAFHPQFSKPDDKPSGGGCRDRTSAEPTEPTTRAVKHVACTVCGCVCDDLQFQVRGNRIADALGVCELAEPFFASLPAEVPTPRIEGQPARLEEALACAARWLNRSQFPLIYGLSRSSTAGQRAACQLADQLGATIDTTASTCHAPSIMAVQSIGESTATLGEIRNRSSLIIYWGSNPVVSHPRHLERFVDPPGMFVPQGRSGRTVIVVDVKPTASTEVADQFIRVNPGEDFELLWALRFLCHPDAKPVEMRAKELPQQVAGVSQSTLVQLARQLRTCRYGAVFFGLGLTREQALPHANVEALLSLVTDLNAHTRFVARRMRIPGDVAGADTVLCWQTGFPFSVNLGRGFPRYNPGEYTAEKILERGETDLVLLVGSEGVTKLSSRAQAALGTLPSIVLDYPNRTCPLKPNVLIPTAIYGVHRPGSVYRMDEVPIPLTGFLESPLPSDDEVLHELAKRCRPGSV